jgi:hypothetical protein
LGCGPWASAAPSSGFINVDGNHPDVDSFVTSPNHNASPNQALAGTLDAIATRDQHTLLWSSSTANNGWNNEWNPDVSIAPPARDPASHGLAQSLVTPGLGQPFTPTLGLADKYSNAIENGQPDPTVQFLVYNDFGVMRNSFVNPTSYTQYDDFDFQETMASFNQLPLPTTTNMPAAPALPTHATNMFTAPAVPRPIARGVTSRRSNANTNAHICGHAGCGKRFARPGDLARHSKQHDVPQHPCDIPGCNRHGLRAFYRADKLLDHQRKKHGRGN